MTLALVPQVDYRVLPACSGLTDIFFSTHQKALQLARDTCASCPVFDECLLQTLANFTDSPYGLRAGLDQRERHAIYLHRRTYTEPTPRHPHCNHKTEGGTLSPIQTKSNLGLYFCTECRRTIKVMRARTRSL